jgi:hypothetical protein
MFPQVRAQRNSCRSVVEAMDWSFHNAGAATEHPELELLPSEYFARQIYSCFWFATSFTTTRRASTTWTGDHATARRPGGELDGAR